MSGITFVKKFKTAPSEEEVKKLNSVSHEFFFRQLTHGELEEFVKETTGRDNVMPEYVTGTEPWMKAFHLSLEKAKGISDITDGMSNYFIGLARDEHSPNFVSAEVECKFLERTKEDVLKWIKRVEEHAFAGFEMSIGYDRPGYHFVTVKFVLKCKE